MPLVGVTTYYAEAAWGPWRRLAGVVPAPYFELVAAAGGRPLLLPPVRSAPDGPSAGAAEVVGALDALVLVGGGDLDPSSYGQARHAAVKATDAGRDRSEDALLGAALAADLPVLAICRGMQVLNVHLGGTLHQHLPEQVGHERHRPGTGRFGSVEVVTEPGSLLAGALGGRTVVQCSHHQAVDRLGDGLVVTARAAGAAGPVVEGVELPGRRFVVGVQWHPEESEDRRLFDALLGAVQVRAEAR
jgi:gamma-glutamyl-gamma-aminobutyrate hydrolase PuuD